MNSDTSYPRHEDRKRKYAEDSLENTEEDQALTLTPKRQRGNNSFLDLQNQDSTTLSSSTRLSSSMTFSFGARLSNPQTFSFESTGLEAAFDTFKSDSYNERCHGDQTGGDALSDEAAYWQLADQYYEAPSDDDVNISGDDNTDESDEDDFNESDDDGDISEGGYEGDDDETDGENTNEDDADDNEGENGDDEDGNDEDEDEEYKVGDDVDEEGMTEEEIGFLLYEIFDATYNTSPYDDEE